MWVLLMDISFCPGSLRRLYFDTRELIALVEETLYKTSTEKASVMLSATEFSSSLTGIMGLYIPPHKTVLRLTALFKSSIEPSRIKNPIFIGLYLTVARAWAIYNLRPYCIPAVKTCLFGENGARYLFYLLTKGERGDKIWYFCPLLYLKT